jgi:hypothetical protein
MASQYLSPPSSPAASYIQPIALPPPPSEKNTPKQIAQVHQALAPYYWRHHFERNPCDPASFIDRIMTDYAQHEGDPVGEWVENMSPLYRAYRACLNYGAKGGTPAKSLEAKRYQKVKGNALSKC